MKKKVLAISLAVALLAIMVTGTLAYFTDTDEVTNVFTVGSVGIEIIENDKVTGAVEGTFGPLVPIVNTQNPQDDPGYIRKAVKVSNDGKNDAFVRLHIAIPTALVGYLYLDLDEAGWTRQADSTADIGVEDLGITYTTNYTIFTYDYNTALENSKFTTELLKGVYLGSDVDLKDNPATDGKVELDFCKLNDNGEYEFSGFVPYIIVGGTATEANTPYILVAAQAIQAQGFDNATAALNAGFPNHPWAK